MRFPWGFVPASILGGALLACIDTTGVQTYSGSPTSVLSEGLSTNRSQQIMLNGSGWGRVLFRQPEDGQARILFITWLRELKPGTDYLLQLAMAPTGDDICTGGVGDRAEWLTLGPGKPYTIPIGETRSFHAPFYRALSRRLVGATFDARLRLIDAATGAVVQQSECFQFKVNL